MNRVFRNRVCGSIGRMRHKILVAGITLLGVGGAFAEKSNKKPKGDKAPKVAQKAKPQKKQSQPKKNQPKQSQPKKSESKKEQSRAKQPQKRKVAENSKGKSSSSAPKKKDKTVEARKSQTGSSAKNDRKSQPDRKGQADRGKEKDYSSRNESESDRKRKNVFYDERRSRAVSYFEKQKGQKYGLPPGIAKKYRADKIPKAWRNRSLQRGYRVPSDYRSYLVTAPTDLISLLGGALTGGQRYYLAGSNLIVVDQYYDVVDVVYLPTIVL